MKSRAEVLVMIGAIPPEAFDAIFPKGPRIAAGRADAVTRMAPTSDRAAFAVDVAEMTHEVVRAAAVGGVKGEPVAWFTAFVDDWCGTKVPRWPLPWPPRRWPGKGEPDPDPWREDLLAMGQLVGALVFASSGAGMPGDSEVGRMFMAGADQLAAAALGDVDDAADAPVTKGRRGARR